MAILSQDGRNMKQETLRIAAPSTAKFSPLAAFMTHAGEVMKTVGIFVVLLYRTGSVFHRMA
jgi:hypothetical protein